MNIQKLSTASIIRELRRRQAIADREVPPSSVSGRRHRKKAVRRGAITPKTTRA